MSTPPKGKLALPELLAMKQRGEKIVMVTAYDAPGARFAEDAGVEIILVGDTAAMVVLGYEGTTVPVTMDEMLFLTRTVARSAQASDRRRRHAVRLVPGLRREGARERDPLRQGGGRRRDQARGRRPDGLAREDDRRRGHRRHGPRRPDAPVGDEARRVQDAGQDGRGRSRAGRQARSRSRTQVHSRSSSKLSPRRSPPRSRDGSRYRRSASAQAATRTARCSSTTTCSGSPRAISPASSSVTRASRGRSATRSSTTPRRCATAPSPATSTPTRWPRRSWSSSAARSARARRGRTPRRRSRR